MLKIRLIIVIKAKLKRNKSNIAILQTNFTINCMFYLYLNYIYSQSSKGMLPDIKDLSKSNY